MTKAIPEGRYTATEQATLEESIDRTLHLNAPHIPCEELREKRVKGNQKYGDIAYNRGQKEFDAINFYAHGREELYDLANYVALEMIAEDDPKRYHQLEEILAMVDALWQAYQKVKGATDI